MLTTQASLWPGSFVARIAMPVPEMFQTDLYYANQVHPASPPMKISCYELELIHIRLRHSTHAPRAFCSLPRLTDICLCRRNFGISRINQERHWRTYVWTGFLARPKMEKIACVPSNMKLLLRNSFNPLNFGNFPDFCDLYEGRDLRVPARGYFYPAGIVIICIKVLWRRPSRAKGNSLMTYF